MDNFKTFKINDTYTIICETSKTRNGFKHTAHLLRNNQDTGEKVKINYINRTWETYTYQSVINKLISSSKIEELAKIKDLWDKINKGNW